MKRFWLRNEKIFICLTYILSVMVFSVWAAQVAIVSTDTREQAWAKETLNNSDLQTNINGKETADAAIVKSDEAETLSAAWDLGTPSALVITNASGTASININGTVGATTPAAGEFTTLAVELNTIDFGDVTEDYVLTFNAATNTWSGEASAGGVTTVDAIGDAAAAGAVDFVTYLQQWDVGTAGFQIGDGGSNYAAFDVTGNISFGGTGGLTGNIVSDYITYTPSATPPATTDGLLRNTTGYTGLGSDTFSFWDGSAIQYLLNYDTLPTVNGSMPTYNSANNDFDWTVPAGSTVASSAEVNTGTDNAKFISPDALAGSNAFTKEVAWTIYDSTTDTAVADGLQFFIVPTSYNGMNLVEIIASVETAGTTGTTDIQIRRVRGATAVDMLSTIATIDTGERDTTTAATPYVINAANDDLATADRIFIDLDAISTTAAKGLSVTALFRLP